MNEAPVDPPKKFSTADITPHYYNMTLTVVKYLQEQSASPTEALSVLITVMALIHAECGEGTMQDFAEATKKNLLNTTLHNIPRTRH